MRYLINDTIAAISTAVGEGGIGIVRVSGNEAVTIVQKIVKTHTGLPLADRRSHSIFLAKVVDSEDGSEVDEVLINVMRAPNTYTREDVVEINCHGGIVPLRKTLGQVLAAGARAAEPGEFTKRAFLNGRIDLAQAEAVIDAIRSKTDAALKMAIHQLDGGLSNNINACAHVIAEVQTQVEAAIDFSDEDIETLPAETVLAMLRDVKARLEELLQTAVRGRMIREGVKVAIVGRPNVGKSSLLNALLRRERAIVTPIPGTTRDVIEESVNIKGVPLVLSDTAGIRESQDEVERIGVELTKKALKTADIVLCVVDGNGGVETEDVALMDEITEPAVLVVNKADLPQAESIKTLRVPANFKAKVDLSALTGTGIDELEKTIEAALFEGDIEAVGTAIITNARHEQLVTRALDHVSEAIELVDAGLPEELIATVLKEILDDLGEVTGESIGEDVLGRIFSQFCIGK